MKSKKQTQREIAATLIVDIHKDIQENGFVFTN